jgi:hypothetical protein
MNAGTENRKKTMLAIGGSVVGLGCLVFIYIQLFAAPPNPAAIALDKAAANAAPPTTLTTAAAVNRTARGGTDSSSSGAAGANGGLGAAPGVDAQKMASTSSSLDPTLDERAMLRTESLVYSGTGRNIFSLVYTPPTAAVAIPKNMPSARPQPVGPPPPPPGPPPPPPINLKFFGTAQRHNGERQAFLLQGEDVYLAAVNDIVARRYKILMINATSVRVEDLTNQNTQTLPLQQN